MKMKLIITINKIFYLIETSPVNQTFKIKNKLLIKPH